MASTEITIFRGDDLDITVQINDADGNGIDLTGSTLFFTVKSDLTDSDDNAAISKDITSHTDAVNGTTEINLSPTDTNISPGGYHYDLQLVDSSGTVITYGKGGFIVQADVTRRTS
jgi:hypothetical protein